MAFRQRNHAFDLLCGICILRMIVLHVAGFCGMRGFLWCEKMMAWTFFFMSFFFFKAGYFNKTVSGNSKEYCIDRTKRLLVPYISWTLIGDAIFFGMMLFNLDMFMPYLEKRITWEHNIMISRPYGNAPIWFLFSFYVAYLFMHFIGKVRHLRSSVIF
ncbi:MAG: acyltransferase family protein [Bacteroidaceae bacterium]|nr:acyltransferase family protein [Bacteroidaceae bacterium]